MRVTKLPQFPRYFRGIFIQRCKPHPSCCCTFYFSVLLFSKTFSRCRAQLNNSVKLMIMGMHNKGKTTLLKHLRAVGRYQDSFFSNLRAIPQGNASIGVKIGTWSYYKDRSGSADQYREILFYTWDYAGEVYSRNNIYCAVIVLLLHRWSTTPLINYSFTLVLSTLWCGKCQMALMECTAFYHGCKKYMYVVIIMYYTNILWL